MQKWTQELNERQAEAVKTVTGPLLIVAGAGAGKTKTLSHRIGYLIEEHGVHPEQILAITFTNKAAKEMRERVFRLLGKKTEGNPTWGRPVNSPWVGTFHGLGVYILREKGEEIGIAKNFHILDRDDALSHVRSSLKEAGIDPKQFEPGKMLSLISRVKSSQHPEETIRHVSQNSYLVSVLQKIYVLYQKKLKDSHALDFDDLLLLTLRLLRDYPKVLDYYHAQWKYIHVDEYQDTNEIQYAIIHLLAQKEKNICVVGDSDQNIYSWRGATIANILRFEEDYPGAKVVLLEENYRSTKYILDAANQVIEKNIMRKPKRLFTNNPDGELLSIFEGYDENDEARFVGNTISELTEKGVSPSEIAILYRTNFQSRVIEEALLLRDIPYQVLGTRFFERKEVKDLVSYIRAAITPSSTLDVTRTINTPLRGIGKVSVEKILAGKKDTLPQTMQKKVNEYFSLLGRIRTYAETNTVSSTIKYAMKESGLADYYAKGDDDELSRLGNIQELVTLGARYDSILGVDGIEQFLSDAALESDQDELDKAKQDGVRLMTVHAAKGLEFPYVFITGLEQDLFPSRRSQAEGRDKSEQEEERRLFYVALTRAAKKVYLSYAGFRTIFGNRMINVPSEFLHDIPDEIISSETRKKSSKVSLLGDEDEPIVYI